MDQMLAVIRNGLIDLLVSMDSKKNRKKVSKLLKELDVICQKPREQRKSYMISFFGKMAAVFKKLPSLYLEHKAFELASRAIGL